MADSHETTSARAVSSHIRREQADIDAMVDSALADSVAELSRILWQQRRVLERLRYCLRVQDLMIDGEDSESLVMAVDDVQGAIDAVRELEAARQEMTFELASQLGQGRDMSFQQLVELVPPPFDEMLNEHRESFLRVVADITSLSLNSRENIERGMRLTRDLVHSMLGDAGDGGYDSRGTPVSGSHERRLLDQQL